MTLPNVSVAMATYNGAKHIRRQLDSLAAQSHLPSELVITDDCSADSTIEVVSDFAKTAPFAIHIHRNETRLGYRANFMKAATLCTSDLIAFCDQDDVWYPGKLDICARILTAHDVYFVYHNADVVTGWGEKIGTLDSYAQDHPCIAPLEFNPMEPTPGFTQVFRRELLQFSDLWPSSLDHRSDEPMAHDQWFRFLAMCTGPTGYGHTPLAAYYQHGANTIGFVPDASARSRRWMKPFRSAAPVLEKRISSLRTRADILEQVQHRLSGNRKKCAIRALKEHRRAIEFSETRRRLYEDRSPYRRLTALLRLCRDGAYQRPWGFDKVTLLKDATLGLPAGPYL
jgi:glycosyltransferase involved in cell wall biosynthesis